jgi:hypothetical protein
LGGGLRPILLSRQATTQTGYHERRRSGPCQKFQSRCHSRQGTIALSILESLADRVGTGCGGINDYSSVYNKAYADRSLPPCPITCLQRQMKQGSINRRRFTRACW